MQNFEISRRNAKFRVEMQNFANWIALKTKSKLIACEDACTLFCSFFAHHILETIGAGRLCSGNNDKRFLSLLNIRKDVLMDRSSAELLDSTLKHGGRKIFKITQTCAFISHCCHTMDINNYDELASHG